MHILALAYLSSECQESALWHFYVTPGPVQRTGLHPERVLQSHPESFMAKENLNLETSRSQTLWSFCLSLPYFTEKTWHQRLREMRILLVEELQRKEIQELEVKLDLFCKKCIFVLN